MALADAVKAAGLSEQEARTELAVTLYAQKRLSEGKAAELAGMNRWEFSELLGKRKIPRNYDVEELQRDVATLRKMGQL